MAKGESKSYNPAAIEPQTFEFWTKGGYFHPQPDGSKPEQRYTIVIPPPNVTAALHLGHALNNTLQDILIRHMRMAGKNTFWLLGTDHAGIATQAMVEKSLKEKENKNRHDLGREEMVRRIWAWKDQHGGRIVEQLKLMGCSCDYERERFTLDDICAKAVRHTFFKLFRDGLIYRGKRLVNWDTQLQTAVADDEVYHETIKGHFWHFKYPIIDPKPGEPTHVHIATTRPETMLADTAVAVHPQPDAELDKTEAELRDRLNSVPAKERPAIQEQIDQIIERRKTHLPTLLKLRDMAKDGRMVNLPLVDRPIPLICDEWARPELGSGCVKITPAHDPNDYEVGQRHDLPLVNVLTEDGLVAQIVEPDGSVNPNSEKYAGLRFSTKGREKVVADLEALGLIEQIEDRMIEIGHSDRSKTAIEPFLSDQWFVRMGDLEPEHAAKIEGLRHHATGLAQMAIDAVKRGDVRFFPPRYEKTYVDWLAEKRDWCISRQLWWGHRIPVWRCRMPQPGIVSAAPIPSDDLLNQLSVEWYSPPEIHSQQSGSVVMPNGDANAPAYAFICLRDEPSEADLKILEACGFEQDPDVLDTWFSSALWPHSTLGWPDADPNDETSLLGFYYPTNVLSTAREIITLWVARMVMTGLYNIGKVPFSDVVIHPLIMDGQGRKMSKTLGNGVDPVDIIEEYGADALRFTLADLATETQDIRLPVKPKKLPDGRSINISEKFEKGRNFCNKLWQASTGFVMRNLDGYDPQPIENLSKLRLEDRWILSRITTCLKKLDSALNRYQFSTAVETIYNFMWDDYCSWYIEMSKPRLAENDGTCRQVLVYVLDQLLRMLHPVAPFVTEAIWAELATIAPRRGLHRVGPAESALVSAAWPEVQDALYDEKVERQMETLQGIIKSLRDIRAEVNDFRGRAKEASIRSLPTATVRGDAQTCQLVGTYSPFVRLLGDCDELSASPDAAKPRGATSRVTETAQIFVPVADLIDLAEARKTEEAKAEELRGALARAEKQLANDNFVKRADPAVVEQTKERAAALSSQIRMIEQHLADLE